MGDEKKKRVGHAKYNDDYVRDSDGKYHYSGKYYAFRETGRELTRIKRGISALTLFALGAGAGAGFLMNAGGSELYVVIPYIFMLMFAALAVIEAVSFCFLPVRFTHREYDSCVRKLYRLSWAQLCSAGTVLLCNFIALLINREAVSWVQEFAYIALIALAGGFSWLSIRAQKLHPAELE
jgi:hypothetical protein